MVVVYEAEHVIDAHLMRGRLEAEGIAAVVLGEWLTGALGELPASGLLRVAVADAAADAARAVVAEWRAADVPDLDALTTLADGVLRA